jgi:biotin transport system substrate-specific component
MKTKTLLNTKDVTLIGLMTALICICGPFSIPIGPIPISLTPFTIALTACILGQTRATLSVLIYLLLGLVGLPVFSVSDSPSGAAKLFGPTGGYLLSFILMAYISGLFIDHFSNIIVHIAGCFLGLTVSYIIGTLWLMYQSHMTLAGALVAAVIPFVPFDIVKIILAAILGQEIKKRIS